MKRRARVRTKIRKAAMKLGKWGGAVVAMLLVVGWISSAWWLTRIMWYRAEWTDWNCLQVYADAGSLHCGVGAWPPDTSKGRLQFSVEPGGLIGWRNVCGEWRRDKGLSPQFSAVTFPIWLPFTVALAGTMLVWRADVRAMRRARVGLCEACGYDLVGLAGTAAGAVCPECGQAKQS